MKWLALILEDKANKAWDNNKCPLPETSADLAVGDAFVVPARHHIAIIAFQNSYLQLAEFEINARNNQIFFLVGKTL